MAIDLRRYIVNGRICYLALSRSVKDWLTGLLAGDLTVSEWNGTCFRPRDDIAAGKMIAASGYSVEDGNMDRPAGNLMATGVRIDRQCTGVAVYCIIDFTDAIGRKWTTTNALHMFDLKPDDF